MSVMDTVIGWIAPPACLGCGLEGEALCLQCANREITPYGERCFGCGAISAGARTCERCAPSAPRFVWVSSNYESRISELIKLYKFSHQRAAVDSIANLMMDTFLRFNDTGSQATPNYLVVSVPTATSRVRQRSFDHCAHLARHIAAELGYGYMNALTRLGQTRQVGAERSMRMSQAANNYLVRYPNLINGQNILLVDDVVTTGATLRATTKALRAAGAARVDALVLAKKL